MKEKMLVLTVLVAAVAMMAAFSSPAMARVRGVCSECHTMHSSQSPSPQEWLNNGWVPGQTPNVALLAASTGCLGCHQAAAGVQNDGSNNIPYVHQTDDPNYGTTGTLGNTTAGGTFYYMKQAEGTQAGDAKAHNVEGISTSQDSVLGSDPPGYDATLGQSLGLPASWTGQRLTCAGTYGCHGDHNELDLFAAISGGHHGDDTPPLDGTSVVKSYRFLLAIKGLEWNTSGATGGRWEYKPTFSEHNQYKGADRTDDTFTSSGQDTISFLCAECHGFFHSSDNAANIAQGGIDDGITWGNWVRHPTDYDMGNTALTSEYRGYGSNYRVNAPVGSADVGTVIGTVTYTDDTIVTCISCHRAHGSNFPDLLRWQYNMDAGSGANTGGCFLCHTTKDDA